MLGSVAAAKAEHALMAEARTCPQQQHAHSILESWPRVVARKSGRAHAFSSAWQELAERDELEREERLQMAQARAVLGRYGQGGGDTPTPLTHPPHAPTTSTLHPSPSPSTPMAASGASPKCRRRSCCSPLPAACL